MQIKKLVSWIKNQRKKNKMQVTKVDMNNLDHWRVNDKKIFNIKRAFFSIIPFKFEQNKKKFFQPLIIQKEVGILGILKKKFKNKDYYLLQAKIEPGNTNGIQLSPTVQATKSNYSRKHGGKPTNYLNFFLKKSLKTKTLSKLKLSEQGTRYYEKANKNILIDLKSVKVKKLPNFIWVSKKHLNYFLNQKNILNMDTISVFSGSIKKNSFDLPLNKFSELVNFLLLFKKKFMFKRKIISFGDLKNWKIQKNKILDTNLNFFSILFLKIKTNSREVKSWDQPIISDHFNSLNGLLIKKINNSKHYLLQATFEPGLDAPKYTSTVLIKNYNKNNDYKNIKYFNFFKKQKSIKFINSDEGGRFYKNETNNLIRILKETEKIKKFENFIWVSHNQFVGLIKKNLITIEARNLFACCNIDKIH